MSQKGEKVAPAKVVVFFVSQSDLESSGSFKAYLSKGPLKLCNGDNYCSRPFEAILLQSDWSNFANFQKLALSENW